MAADPAEIALSNGIVVQILHRRNPQTTETASPTFGHTACFVSSDDSEFGLSSFWNRGLNNRRVQMKKTMLFLTLVALVGLGCDSNTSTQEVNNPSTGKADGTDAPVGTFQGSSGYLGDMTLLVLKTDNTYHRERLIECFHYPCPKSVDDGSYMFTRNGSMNASSIYSINLKDDAGFESELYGYTFDGNALTLYSGPGYPQHEQVLVKAENAWCNVVDDCKIQNLPEPRCMCEATCVENTCGWTEIAPVCKPVCISGDNGNGWYNSCDGTFYCQSQCSSSTVAECGDIGTRSEGWYTNEPNQGCEGISNGLIGWATCSQ
jgi:hypothetical protein